MKKFIVDIVAVLSIIFLSSAVLKLQAQFITPCEETLNLNFPDSICLNDEIFYSPLQSELTIDFCPGELAQPPIPTTNIDLSQVSKIRGLKFVSEDGNWYGFFTSRDNNVLLRLDYGNSLQNAPSIVNLGNVGSSLLNPESIDIIEWEGVWYGYIHNTNSARVGIVQLEFGNSISNAPTASSLISNVGGALTSIKLIAENNQLHLALTNFSDNTISILNLGDPASKLVQEQFKSSPLSQTSGMTDISLLKTCGTWKALLTVFNSRTIKWLEFSNGLMANPTVTDIGFNAFNGFRPYNGTLVYENDTYYLTITSFEGSVFKQEVNAANPPITGFWTNVGDYSDNVRASTIVKENSTWNHYFVNEITGILNQAEYAENCDEESPIVNESTLATFRFTSDGIKRFTYYGITEDGSYYSQIDSIYVFQAPKVDIEIIDACLNSEAGFVSTVSFEFGTSVSYLWDFGDPSSPDNTSSLPDPTHIFSTAGDYDVSLTVTDECGVQTETVIPLTIYPDNELSPDFSTDDLLCSNGQILFTDESSAGNDEISEWLWDFDGLGQSDIKNPEFLFNEPGDYQITLTIAGEFNCKASITKTITVEEGPNPSFTVNDACQGSTMQFTNTSTGAVTSYFWDFDNGLTSTLENPMVTFDDDGQYNVSLTLTNSAGCVSTYQQAVTVYALPDVSFSNELACEKTPTQFLDESAAVNANIVGWHWDFGDPGSENNTSDIKEATHVFSAAGTYDVTLTVTTNFGCEASATQQVTVLPSPTAAFSYDQACIGEPVTFQDNSFPPSGQSLTSWAWDLGGTFSSQRNPTTTFNFARSYDVTLVVTASNQCIGRYTEQVVINDPPNIQIGIQQPCAGSPATFIDLTESPADPVVSRSWDFAGQGLSSDSVAQFTFSNTGTYQVTLSVTLESGCTFSKSQAVRIDASPVASFNLESTFGPPPFTISAQNTSQNAVTQQWLLNDVVIGTNPTLEYQLDEFGSYELALVASSGAGCRDTAFQMIQVTNPDLDIAVSGLQVTFTDSQGGNGYATVSFIARNNGTLDLESLPVTVILDADYEITQEIDVFLPSDNSPVTVTMPLQVANRVPLNICVRVPEQIMGVPDVNPANNTVCSSNQQVLVYAPYPNPAISQLNMDILSTGDEEVHIEVFSASGIKKFSGTLATGTTGLNTWALDLTGWAAGTYILQAVTSEGRRFYRFVIQQ